MRHTWYNQPAPTVLKTFNLDKTADEMMREAHAWSGLNFTGIMRNLVYGWVVVSHPPNRWSSTIHGWYAMFDHQDRYPNPIWYRNSNGLLTLRGRVRGSELTDQEQ